jgi:WD40 repeat protein
MGKLRGWALVIGWILSTAQAVFAQQTQGGVDFLGDPMPEGAIARLGTLRLRQPSRSIAGVALSPDGKFIVTTGDDTMAVRVWDAGTGKELRQLQTTGLEYASPIVFSPDGAVLAAGSVNDLGCDVVLWDFATGKELRRLRGNPHHLQGLAFANRGKAVVAVCDEGVVREWDVATGLLTRKWNAFAELNKNDRPFFLIKPAAFSTDGTLLAAVAEQKEVNGKDILGVAVVSGVWDVVTEKVQWRVDQKLVTDFSPDGKMVMVHGGSRAISLCDSRTGKEVKSFRLTSDRSDFFDAVAYSPDGKTFVGLLDWEVAQVWDLSAAKMLKEFAVPWAGVAMFFPDGERLLLVNGNQLSLWSIKSGKELLQLPGHRAPIGHLTFSADGKRFLSGEWFNYPRRLSTWDTSTWKETGRKVLSYDERTHWPPSASLVSMFSLVDHQDVTLNLHDLAKDKPIRPFDIKLESRWAHYGFFAPNNQLLRVYSNKEVFPPDRLLDAATGETICTLAEGTRNAYAFTQDNRKVAWFEADNTIRVFDVALRKIVLSLGAARMHEWFTPTSACNLLFSPDGKWLASWSAPESSVRIWDLKTGKLYRDFRGKEQANVSQQPWCALAFSADGATLAVGWQGHNVELWELITAKERRRFSGHTLPVTALAFSPDGRLLASGSEDTTVLIWDVVNQIRMQE